MFNLVPRYAQNSRSETIRDSIKSIPDLLIEAAHTIEQQTHRGIAEQREPKKDAFSSLDHYRHGWNVAKQDWKVK